MIEEQSVRDFHGGDGIGIDWVTEKLPAPIVIVSAKDAGNGVGVAGNNFAKRRQKAGVPVGGDVIGISALPLAQGAGRVDPGRNVEDQPGVPAGRGAFLECSFKISDLVASGGGTAGITAGEIKGLQ